MSFITSPGVIVPPLTAGGVAYGTGSQAKVTSAGTTGQVLKSAGAGVPTWATSTAGIPVTVPEGGTSLTTLTANNVILGNGTSAPLFVAPSTSGNVLTSNGTTWASVAIPLSGFTLGAPVTLTSGTFVDFTGIPAGVKIINIMFLGVSSNTSSRWIIQIGDATSIKTTGYVATSARIFTVVTTQADTTGFIFAGPDTSAANTLNGNVVLSLENSATNNWVSTGLINSVSAADVFASSGAKTLTQQLTRLRITTLGGDTFDAGEINISYSP